MELMWAHAMGHVGSYMVVLQTTVSKEKYLCVRSREYACEILFQSFRVTNVAGRKVQCNNESSYYVMLLSYTCLVMSIANTNFPADSTKTKVR